MKRRKVRGMQSKLCPYPGCTCHMSLMHFLCWGHWSALPMAMQDDITETNLKKGRHIAAEKRDAAIKYLVRKAEQRKEQEETHGAGL